MKPEIVKISFETVDEAIEFTKHLDLITSTSSVVKMGYQLIENNVAYYVYPKGGE